jgi:hypothetical protein
MNARLIIRSLTVAAVLVAAACGGGTTPQVETPKGEGGGKPVAGEPMKFDSDCVDPVADGDKHDPTRPFDKHVQLDVRNDDLDGDGVVDIFVKPAWSCGNGCNRSAYVSRGTCGHYVGTFPSEDNWEVLPETTNGLHDIKARPKKSDGEQLRCFQLIVKYDGKAYQVSKHRECECKDEAPKCEGDWTEGATWMP